MKKIKTVLKRIQKFENWYWFVFPLSRLRKDRIAKLRNGTQFFIRSGFPAVDFAMLFDIVCEDDLDLESFKNLPVIVDVGAHIGIFSILVAKMNLDSKVIAIEPEKTNFEILLKNISLNNLRNITPLNALVYKNEGVGRLYLSESNAGHSVVENMHVMKERKKFQEVKMITLDSIGKINGLKIDVEGAEYDIFEENIPDCDVLVMDIHRVPGKSVDNLLGRFRDKYSITELGEGKTPGSKTVKMIRYGRS